MIAVLAYWLLLFFIFLQGGLLLNKILKLHTHNVALLLLLGMLFYSVTFTATAFFVPLNLPVFLCSLLASLLFAYFMRKDLSSTLCAFKATLSSLTLTQKIILTALTIAAALKSAQLPTIIDNESYYVQTIKWLNEYGFVKGLGNLHPFLAQMSGWHVLQAGVNLNFITDRINDSNGFIFVVSAFFCFAESSNTKSGISFIALVPVFSALFFLFIDSPSPDLPLILLTPVMFYLLVKHHVQIPWLLFLFMVFIKVTIAPLGLLFLYPLFRARAAMPVMAVSGVLVAVLWIGKNIITSGYLLYPVTTLPADVDWQVPKHLLNGLHASSNNMIYGTTVEAPLGKKFISWLTKGGIDGLCNIAVTALFALLPFFRKVRKGRRLKIIYLVCLIHFVIIFAISPQFRFFLPVAVFFLCFLLAETIMFFGQRQKLYTATFITGMLAAVATLKNVDTSQLCRPGQNSAYADIKYSEKTTGNLTYYSPQKNFFIYGTADGPLPCVNLVQLQWFKEKYNVVPQMRGKTISEGFYSTPTLPEDE